MDRAAAEREDRSHLIGRIAPLVFVLLWSTGFIGAKLGAPHAEPLSFLAVRFALASALLLPFAILMGAPWPRSWRQAGHIAVTGLLVHAIYLGCVFIAIDQGLPAGLAALIVCLQPIAVALAARPLLGERIRPIQVVGLILGLLGVGMVLSEKIDPGAVTAFEGFGFVEVGLCVVALLSIAAGTIYQKRFGQAMDLRSGTAIQYLAATAMMLPAALLVEDFEIAWTGEFVIALAWLVLVLSIGAISLLMLLIRLGEASKVASFFYLVPPATAVLAYLAFDERLGWLALSGLAVAATGVALVVRR